MAEALGMTREELLSRISSAELTEWMAEYSVRAMKAKDIEAQQAMLRKIKGRRGF